jgi:drug/metabolite transporter (DMT)-like permease
MTNLPMSLHQTSGKWRLGLTLSLLTVFLWGVLPIALSVTLQALDVYTVTWFRFLVSFGILAIYLTIRKQLPPWEKWQTISVKLLAIAIIFLALNYILYLKGLNLTTPANAQVLIQIAPVLMGMGGLIIFKERYTLRQWIGLGVLTLGLVLFFNEQLQNLITARGQYLIGCGLIVIAAAVWAVYALAQKQLLQRLPSSNIMLLIYGGCALLFTPFANPQPIFTLSPLHWGALIFCAFNTVVAYGAFAESLEHWEASKVSAVLATTPIVTLLGVWGMSLFLPTLIAPERLTILGVMGAILVVGGSVAIALRKKSVSLTRLDD